MSANIATLILFLFLYVLSGTSHAHEEVINPVDLADSFFISPDHLKEQEQEIQQRLQHLFLKLQHVQHAVPKNPRAFSFYNRETLTELEKNAAADILIESMMLSLEFAEKNTNCHTCYKDIPLRYLASFKLAVQNMKKEMKDILQSSQGSSFEKLESLLTYYMIKYHLSKEAFVKNIAHFLNGMGVKIGGDLAEIYGQRGSVALILVFLTWPPYTFISETIEHSLIGPFAVFCMTSQLIYFGVIRSTFDLAANTKNTFLYRVFTKDSQSVFSDVFKLMLFEMKLRYRFGVIITQDRQVLSRKKIKKALHIDFMSRTSNIIIGFENIYHKLLYRMGLTPYFFQKQIQPVRIDSFLYFLLGTANWSDLAQLEKSLNLSPQESETAPMSTLTTNSSGEANNLSLTLQQLLKEQRPLEAYSVIKEMYYITELLKKQLASSLRIMKEQNLVSLKDYLFLKLELGRIYYYIQKVRYASLIRIADAKASSQDVDIILKSYQGLVQILKTYHLATLDVSRNETLDKNLFQQNIQIAAKNIYHQTFGFHSQCYSYFKTTF